MAMPMKSLVSLKKKKGDESLGRKTGNGKPIPGSTPGGSGGGTVPGVVGVIAESKEMCKEKEDDIPPDVMKVISCYSLYFGVMPREEIESFLQYDGDFLLRKTDVAGVNKVCISCKHNGLVKHVLLKYEAGFWVIHLLRSANLAQLLEHFYLKNTSITKAPDGPVLTRFIKRPDYYIPHEEIEIGKRLGGGAFGDVFMGTIHMNKDGKESFPAAIKRLKGKMQKADRLPFLKEAKTMRPLDHDNIVRIHGIAPMDEPMMIVLELCPGGMLKSRVSEAPVAEMTPDRLLRYAKDAARGMTYLSVMKIIHRDIAARNCLVGAKDEVKISDFGLSESNMEVLKLSQLKKVPIKWLAPEVINKGEFSSKSDVWAFGVLLWEIFSRCKSDPFPGMASKEIREKILGTGRPMEPPEGSPHLVKATMIMCFDRVPSNRADFINLFQMLCPDEPIPKATNKIDKEGGMPSC